MSLSAEGAYLPGRITSPWPCTTTSRSATSAGSSRRVTALVRADARALERDPGDHLGLHYSGPLLAWIRAERPAFIDRLAALVERGQVEIVGGGWYEPVLAALPERDRIGQLVRMADELEALFGRRPRGAWLAERVWEPDLPTSLATAGYDWTILDDAHFRAAAIHEEALWGPYTTDDQGRVLTVFGTEQGLRYRIPFAEVDDVIGYLQDHATERGDRLGTMGDDGEKFGGWPTTFEHSWGPSGWVERFFEALDENRDGWRRRRRRAGSTARRSAGSTSPRSYSEMGEWALPADEGVAFAGALHDAAEQGRPEARWMRGGLAQLPGQVPRGQRPPQADAPGEAAPLSRRCRPGRPGTPP